MVWDFETRQKLLNCWTDAQISAAFPGRNLESLKRRKREFLRTDEGPEARNFDAVTRDRLTKVSDLLERSGIPLEEVSRVDKVRLSEWQGMHKDESGNAIVTDLEASEIVLTPKWADGPQWPVIQPADPVTVMPASLRVLPTGSFKTAVVLPDVQIGYRRDMITGELDSFHDERAMACALQVIRDIQPSLVVHLGDTLDLAEVSRHPQEASFARTTQAAINRTHRWLGECTANSAPGVDARLLEGNHDRRLETYITQNAQAAFGLQRANLPESWPVMSIPNLLRLDELGVEYVPGYPANITWINDNLACVHGSKARSNGSTAAAVIDDERVSVIFGHIHRIELQHKTRRTRAGVRTTFAASPGCLSRIDGAVPGVKGSTDPFGRPLTSFENWQQGIGVVTYEEGDGMFHLETVPIHDGKAIFRGRIYGD